MVAGDLPLSRVLLMNDCRFPWLVLVPRRPKLKELFHLTPDDYHILMDELRMTSKHLAELTSAHKMNVATLGNMVPQLHFHVIARFEDDMAWPEPVWNTGPPEPYEPEESAEWLDDIRQSLNLA